MRILPPMSFNLKSYLKLSAIYTIAAAFPVIIQIFILPLIEGQNLLGADEFSRIAISESISTFVGTIILFSMSGAISRFYYDFIEDRALFNGLFSSILIGILSRGILILGLGVLMGDWVASFFNQPELQNFSSYGFGSIAIGINRSINITVITLFRNERKVMLFVLVNFLVAALRTAGQLIGVFYFDMSFSGYVNGTAVGGAIMTVFLLIYIFRQTGVQYSRTVMKPVYSFAIPLFIYELVKWGVMFSDRLFLEKFPVELGIYDTAQRFAFGIYYIFQGLYGAAQPDFFLYLTQGIQKTANDLRRLSNIYMLQAQVAVLALILPVIAYISIFFETALTKSASLIAVVFSQYILIGMNTLFSLPIIYYKKTNIYLYINIVSLATSLLLNFWLIPELKIYGAIVSFYAANSIQLLLIFRAQKRIVSIPWNLQKCLWLPLATIGIAVVAEVTKKVFSINPLLMAVIVVALSSTVLGIFYRALIKEWIEKFGIETVKKFIFGQNQSKSP